MCLLALRHRAIPGLPLVVAANRDEDLARTFEAPRRQVIEDRAFVAPVDGAAGGTWIGVNAAGMVVAVTNRPQREIDPRRRSRGLLAVDALRADDMDRLRNALDRHLRFGAPYNNFHLLVADAEEAFVVRYQDGWPELTELEPGTHFLTNDDELDEPRVAAVAADAGADASAEAERMAAILANHDPCLPGGRAPCKHDGGRGTVTASAIVVPESGLADAVWRFAPGPPCTTAFVDVSSAVREMAR